MKLFNITVTVKHVEISQIQDFPCQPSKSTLLHSKTTPVALE